MRRLFTVFRAFSTATASCAYRPFYPFLVNSDPRIDAVSTLFPTEDRMLLTVVNPTPTGAIRNYTATFFNTSASWRWFDLWSGRPVVAVAVAAGGVAVSATSNDEYGAIVGVSPKVAASREFADLVAAMAGMTRSTIDSFSPAPVGAINNTFYTNSDGTVPAGLNKTAMVAVPQTTDFVFQYQALLGEQMLEPIYPIPASKYGTRPAPPAAVGAFVLDKYPVTNAEYAAFITASGYSPAEQRNFLNHWDSNGTVVPAKLARSPVVWVSNADASAYCGFHGKRLPDEWEWAFAAQGSDHRRWPWGNTSKGSCMPPSYNANGSPAEALPAVDSFDGQGCSGWSGAEMMVGSVWQWTNSLEDAHTATALVKGGSTYFRDNVDPKRSFYYFSNCASEIWAWKQTEVRPIECHGELYMMNDGYERASTIGFRCAADDGPRPPQPVPPPPPPPSPPGPPRPGADPRWFGGAGSTAAKFTWSDGAPNVIPSPKVVQSGMYSRDRTFGMTVSAGDPAHGTRAARTLKVFAGTFCTGGMLTVTGDGNASAAKRKTTPPPPMPCSHSTGTVNMMWEVTYAAGVALTVSWTPYSPLTSAKSGPRPRASHGTGNISGGGQRDADDWNLTFMSAALGSAECPSAGCAPGIDIADPTILDPATVTDLTDVGGIDWVHWGGMDQAPSLTSAALPGPLYPERKASGNAAIVGFVR